MDYVRLGRAGVKVSRLCLGTAFRGYWNGHTEEATAIRTVETAIDLGCNFIDCANYYYQGRCEDLLGKAIKGKREDLVVTTKVWSRIGEGPNDQGLSRFAIMREVERSLNRLQTDYIDIYLLHNWDPNTELDETLKAFDDLVRQGKVRYVGACNFTAAQTVEALWTADRGGLDPFFVLQNQYNILQRWDIEPEILPICRQYGMGMMTYSPLAVGLLTGRFRRGQTPPVDSAWTAGDRFDAALDEKTDQIIQQLVDIGEAQNKTPAQVAIAWILANDDVTAPIIGPDRPEHVEEVFGALEVEFSAEQLQALDELSQWQPLTRTH
ncbi:MAG: aldo/keto reductase [Gemmatimonadetes bacterium]|jgi:aryl-alcohol dehydrogenase-like predicted oxidoreductase|nr:aldo/keto reductase [Gemmatimonadota bacterium]MBT5324955.1 aldo/keto reductase [Gemmatimonadota bacterium]MBT5448445.1 aldo/keto reductase [Gemmatimonadota bacterium]MBT5804064.1 aldo/keto reductase [Gemmatimonadota bacterium]MBT6620787.1 aldo/keto reductase [Gemmatimonadota bacterium]